MKTIKFKSINETMSTKEITDIICQNHEAAERLTREIAKLRKQVVDEEPIEEDIFADCIVEDESSQVVDIRFHEVFKKYWDKYKNINSTNFDSLDECLPNDDEYRYQDILRRLIAESFMEIRAIRELEKDLGSSPDLTMAYEIELKKIAHVRSILMEEELEEEVLNENYGEPNEIILIPNENGRILALDELDGIDESFYLRIFDILHSIITGTFKKMKRFTTTDADLAGFSEVKGFKVRVFFRQLDKNKYAIVSIFVKKSDNEKSYRKYLHNAASTFRKVESTGILRNPEFLNENTISVQELWNILSRNSDVRERISGSEELKRLIKGGE